MAADVSRLHFTLDLGMKSERTIAVHSNIGANVVGLTCWSASYNGGAATPPYHAEMIRPANVIVISHNVRCYILRRSLSRLPQGVQNEPVSFAIEPVLSLF